MRLIDAFHRKPFEAFIGKSVKYVIATGVTVVLFTSESQAPLYYAILSILNSALGKLLKKIIRQPRPELSRKSSYGMPSTHTLAAVYFCCIVYGRLDTILPNPMLCTILYALSTVYTIMACSWRVTSHLHTTGQVLVGALIGASSAALALHFESDVMAFFEQIIFPLLAPVVVQALRLSLCLVALPVVFKKELMWAVHKKKKLPAMTR